MRESLVLNRNGTVSQHALRKAETRRKLLASARELMAQGEAVSVAGAATHAGISVATAYRYFSEAETLRIEAGIELDMGAEGRFLRDFRTRTKGDEGIGDRVVTANRIMMEFVRGNEAAYRIFIAKGHEQRVRDRNPDQATPAGSRCRALLELAIEPARRDLGAGRLRDLLLSLMAVSGPETDFSLRDNAQLDRAESDRITEQVLRDVVRAHLSRP